MDAETRQYLENFFINKLEKPKTHSLVSNVLHQLLTKNFSSIQYQHILLVNQSSIELLRKLSISLARLRHKINLLLEKRNNENKREIILSEKLKKFITRHIDSFLKSNDSIPVLKAFKYKYGKMMVVTQ